MNTLGTLLVFAVVLGATWLGVVEFADALDQTVIEMYGRGN